ncbi:AAA family ATPase [Serratia marcescens]|uniref:AAA family ATPase n=2 Tax=Serratia marcescens TaxID=615 RepID=A0A1Q4NUY8_SERMA|nr:AAA family ATPase [Serratia marcescens]
MKICILGPSGAGKSTISRALSDTLGIPNYEFDEVYWNLSGPVFVRNSGDIMAQKIKGILNEESWIVEGAYDQRMVKILNECDLILKVETRYRLRSFRLVKRYILSKLQGKQPTETIRNTIQLLNFSYHYEKKLRLFLKDNKEYMRKTVVVTDYPSCVDAIRKRQ